jgi:multidrug efflux pump
VREFPEVKNAIITIVTNYTGAEPEVIESFITSTLEDAISPSKAINYMTSTSTPGVSTIKVYMHLNYDTDKALTEISTYVNSALSQLPSASQQPQVSIEANEATDMMYIAFYSDILARNNISDYLLRVIQPQLLAVDNVLAAEIIGERRLALRAWIDPIKLAAHNLTANDIADALLTNDFLTNSGRVDGHMVSINLTANTNLTSVEEFRNIIVKYQEGAVVRLRDIATVALGAQNYDSEVSFDNKSAVFIGIQVYPGENETQVINEVKDRLSGLEKDLPQGLNAKIIYDATDSIKASLNEVITNIFESFIIVALVIFLFVGTIRSIIVPAVTIPLSLTGTLFIIYIFGYSINLLTLLALVLATGLVTNDTIIMVNNINRHIRSGLPPIAAAIKGTRELAYPILASTGVLIAAYLPIVFMGGLTGALLTEFLFTLAAAVTISSILALTLAPMVSARVLRKQVVLKDLYRYAAWVSNKFNDLREAYRHSLECSLEYKNITVMVVIIIICSLFFLYASSTSELAPVEDQGLILVNLTAAPNASLYQTGLYSHDYTKKLASFPEAENVFSIDGNAGLSNSIGTLNTSYGGMILKPWAERKTSHELLPLVQKELDHIAGGKIAVYQPATLPNSSGLPIQFIILTTQPFHELYEISSEFLEKAQETGMFNYIDNDLKLDMLQATIEIDRDKAAELGLSMEDIGKVLSAALSQNSLNYFDYDGRSYQVILHTISNQHSDYEQILNYYIKTENGDMVPLSTIAKIKSKIVPESFNHFQQLNAATISAVPDASVTLGVALERLQDIAKDVLPDNFEIDYGGESRQYEKKNIDFRLSYAFSVSIVFLTLAVLFGNFRDPLIILISVPLSLFGALLFTNLNVGGASLNIFTGIGFITLIGLSCKQAFLIVQFANSLQLDGNSKKDAIVSAAVIYLRPITVTTCAVAFSVIPFLFASQASAEARFNIGIVIAAGISIGTVFTLYILPAMYVFLGKVHHRKKHI